MHLASFLIVALVCYFPAQIGAQGTTTLGGTPGSTLPSNTGSTTPSNTGKPDPKIIQVNCTSAYMPLSDADLAAMQNNGTTPTNQTNLSTVPTEAACKSNDANDKDGSICDITSCSSPQPTTCSECYEANIQNGQISKVSTTPVPQVQCLGGYFLGTGNPSSGNPPAGSTPDANSNNGNICTGNDKKTYSCSGQCQNTVSCTSCVSLTDPALAGP